MYHTGLRMPHTPVKHSENAHNYRAHSLPCHDFGNPADIRSVCVGRCVVTPHAKSLNWTFIVGVIMIIIQNLVRVFISNGFLRAHGCRTKFSGKTCFSYGNIFFVVLKVIMAYFYILRLFVFKLYVKRYYREIINYDSQFKFALL